MKIVKTKSTAPVSRVRKRRFFAALTAFAVVFFTAGTYSKLETTDYIVTSNKLPVEFDGFRIVLISDFHLKDFGDRESELINAVWAADPDLIALAGDITDKKQGSMERVRELLEGICGVVPVYAIAGNHELGNINRFQELQDLYDFYGVKYLDYSSVIIMRSGASVCLYAGDAQSGKRNGNNIILPEPENAEYNILLMHYGNRFDEAARYGYDLVLSGHIHGGVIRLPFIGGLIGNQELFPKYDAGAYQSGNSVMILSRGLGDTIFPRLFNRRELVSITLRRSENEI